MVQIVKGSDTYTEEFKMKAVNPDGVLFRFLPNITSIDKRMAFVNGTIEAILNPPKRERRQVTIADAEEKTTELRDALLIYMDGTMMKHYTPREVSEEEVDFEIFSGMLTAIQGFINSTFDSQKGFKTLRRPPSSSTRLSHQSRWSFSSAADRAMFFLTLSVRAVSACPW